MTPLAGWASQVVLVVKKMPAHAGDIRDTGSISGWGRSPEGRHGNPLQYSCLEESCGQSSLVGSTAPTVHGVCLKSLDFFQPSLKSEASGSAFLGLASQSIGLGDH